MEVSWLLVQQIASMVLMGLAGYGVGKLKLITGEQSRVLSCMCIYLAVPCSLMTSFNTAMGGGQADRPGCWPWGRQCCSTCSTWRSMA